MKSPSLVAVAALAIFAFGACSGSGTATTAAGSLTAAPDGGTTTPAPSEAAATTVPSTGGSVEVCGLLTAADLKTVTGKDYAEGVADPTGGCTWNVGASGVNQGELVYAIVQDLALDFVRTNFTGGSDVTVSGHAGYWHPGQGLGSMWIDIGGRVFVLSFPRSADLTVEDQAIAQKLAEIAVGKM